MKKKILFLMALLAVSLLALAEMTVYVYKKDGTKVPYVASTVDSIGFVDTNINANGININVIIIYTFLYLAKLFKSGNIATINI